MLDADTALPVCYDVRLVCFLVPGHPAEGVMDKPHSARKALEETVTAL